jgi:4-amino-4-deoxy-L-arabinose transferase-like glycosyltransferase
VNAALAFLPRDRRLYAAIALLLTLVWLGTLAGRPLFNPDEGRYAEIPREMLSLHDWVIPHLNHLPYIEKPPLQYWATALSYAVFGANEFAARLYTALCALATVVATAFVAQRLFGESGWRAAATLSGMLMFLVLGQLLTLDMSLTWHMTLCLAGFLLAQRAAEIEDAEAVRRWMLVAWCAAALGVLTKGLEAAVIPAAVLVLYSIWTRDWSPWRHLHLARGLTLFLAITIPWHWLAAHRDPDFLRFFFVHEHFARYLTPEADREAPWWFFGYVLLVGTLPWTFSLVRVIVTGWRAPGAQAGAPRFDPQRFLWLWSMFVVVFFSLSSSKLMPYILPALPALALLIANLPAQRAHADMRVTAMLTVAAGVALGWASFDWAHVLAHSNRAEYFLPLAKPLREIAALLLVTGTFVLVRRADVTRMTVLLGAGWCLAWLLVVRAAAVVAPIYSGVSLAAALPAPARDAPIYSVGDYDQSLTFYLRRPVTLVRFRGELSYGLDKADAPTVPSLEQFVTQWAEEHEAYAVMRRSMYDELQGRGVPMKIIGQNAVKVLVARP